MDSQPLTMATYLLLLGLISILQDVHSTNFHDSMNIDQMPQFKEETGSSLSDSLENSQNEKKGIEQRGTKKESTLIDSWKVYDENGEGVEQDIKSLCVSAHKFLRKKHLDHGKVRYSKRLEKDARRWAKHLADKDLFTHEQGVHVDFGENLYKLENNDGIIPNPIHAIAAWYWESWAPRPGIQHKNYDYSFNPDNRYTLIKSGVNHFTQVVWDKSTKIGCGAATKTYKVGKTTWTRTIIVTRYLAPGNVLTKFKQHVFPLKNGDKTLEGLSRSKLYPGKPDCVDSLPAEFCAKWKRLQLCNRDWVNQYCECTCS